MCAREGDLVSLWTHAGSREEMYQDVFVSYMCKKCFFFFCNFVFAANSVENDD